MNDPVKIEDIMNEAKEEFMSKKYPKRILITRHKGLEEWLKAEGIVFDKVYEYVTLRNIYELEGVEVWGNLPISFAGLGNKYIAINITFGPEENGVSLTKEDLEEKYQMNELAFEEYKVEHVRTLSFW